MARIKGALGAKKKHKRVLKMAKGYVGARSRQYRIAKQAVMRAMASQFVGRKQVKRDYRRLWITRINAAARTHDLSYSRLMHALKQAGISINRKMLAEMAVNDSAAFGQLVKAASGQ